MPALHRRLASGRDGAGVRKPPKEETAPRKGVDVAGAIYGDLITAREHCRALGMAADGDLDGQCEPGKRLAPRHIQPPSAGKIIALPQVGGLHHRFERRAA